MSYRKKEQENYERRETEIRQTDRIYRLEKKLERLEDTIGPLKMINNQQNARLEALSKAYRDIENQFGRQTKSMMDKQERIVALFQRKDNYIHQLLTYKFSFIEKLLSNEIEFYSEKLQKLMEESKNETE